MSVRPAKTDLPGHLPSLISVFAVRMKKAWVLSYPLSAQRRHCSDWADAQADLNLRWAHSHFVGFVMSRLTFVYFVVPMTWYRLGLEEQLPSGTIHPYQLDDSISNLGVSGVHFHFIFDRNSC